VFVPLPLAILLSFALGAFVMRLRGWHFGRVPSIASAVAAVVAAAFWTWLWGPAGLLLSRPRRPGAKAA